MYSKSEIMHAAIKTLDTRSEQFGDELYHYGRKGMKWGKNIFEDDPLNPVEKSDTRNRLVDELNKRYDTNTKKSPLDVIKNKFESGKDKVVGDINKTKSTVNSYGKAYDLATSKFGDKAVNNAIARYGAKQAENTVKDTATNAYNTATNKINAVGNAGKTVNNAYNYATSKFGDKAVNNAIARYGAKQAGEAASDAGNKIKETAYNTYSGVKQDMNEFKAKHERNRIKSEEKKEARKAAMNTKLEDLKSRTESLGEKMREGASAAGEKIREGAQAAGEKIKEGANKVVDEAAYKVNRKKASDNAKSLLSMLNNPAIPDEDIFNSDDLDPDSREAKAKKDFEKSLQDAGYEDYYYANRYLNNKRDVLVYALRNGKVDTYNSEGLIFEGVDPDTMNNGQGWPTRGTNDAQSAYAQIDAKIARQGQTKKQREGEQINYNPSEYALKSGTSNIHSSGTRYKR